MDLGMPQTTKSAFFNIIKKTLPPPPPIVGEFRGQGQIMGFQLMVGGYRFTKMTFFSYFTPNSFVMVNYKTFHLKHYIVFMKICPPTGQITFYPILQGENG